MKNKILVTGVAGFIGFHTVKALLLEGHEVVGIDNINDYYPISLKYDRLQQLGIEQITVHYNKFSKSTIYPSFRFMRMDVEDAAGLMMLCQVERFDKIIHLAAQAGVRYSIENPKSYVNSNIVGFLNVLEVCRHTEIKHLVYASSSSVYGMNSKQPFSVEDNVDNPVSLYAATKKSNELMAHAYSYLYNIPTTGLRFFTVYGPWGRPDMAPFLFANAICKEETLKVFNNGDMARDFTYIDDIVEGIVKITQTFIHDELSVPFKIFNIGYGSPVRLLDFIECLSMAFRKEPNKVFLPMQMGDVKSTWADISDLEEYIGYKPSINIKEGVLLFVDWYKKYYMISNN